MRSLLSVLFALACTVMMPGPALAQDADSPATWDTQLRDTQPRELAGFMASPITQTDGVPVAMCGISNSGYALLAIGSGPGVPPTVRLYAGWSA